MIPTDLRHFTPDQFKAPSAAVDTRLCRELDSLRETVDRVCLIHCTYATSGHAAHSRHYLSPCDAADLHFEHADPAAVLRAVLAGPWGGVGWYPHWAHPGWHLDLRPGRRVFWVCTADGYVYGLPVLLKAVGLTLAEVAGAGGKTPSAAFLAVQQGFTAAAEGGLTDNPADPGGITNYGISFRFLRGLGLDLGDIDHDGDIDADDIRALTPADASRLLWLCFWEALKLDRLPRLTAAAVYDFAVNSGTSPAVKSLQQACNFYPSTCVSMDGLLGAETRTAVDHIATSADSDLTLALRVTNVRRSYLRGVSAKRPEAPITGWLNRCDALDAWCQRQIGR